MTTSADAETGWAGVTGWRRVVGRALAAWYLTIIVVAIAGFFVLWLWFLRGGMTDAYWDCMDSQIPPLREQNAWAGVRGNFWIAEDLCPPRPNGLSDEAAIRDWTKHWEAASS
jgi:hypothetical protein